MVTHQYKPLLAMHYPPQMVIKNPQNIGHDIDFLFHLIVGEVAVYQPEMLSGS